jgi:hypothetical protein
MFYHFTTIRKSLHLFCQRYSEAPLSRSSNYIRLRRVILFVGRKEGENNITPANPEYHPSQYWPAFKDRVNKELFLWYDKQVWRIGGDD